jgi:LysR family glycine cleavage system transcriptional activator
MDVMSSLPPLTAVKVFEAAARHGNFTRAAEELGMTQASVSYQIKVLEERVGTPLFLRQSRRVVLSEAGERLAGPVREALDLLRSAFAATQDSASGVLAISSVQTFATNWLVPRLGSFNQVQPGVAVRLELQSHHVDFTREAIDVGLRSGKGEWPGLAAHLLLRGRFTPMLAPALMERLGPAPEPADLLRLSIIGPNDPWWPIWFAAAGVDAPGLETKPDIRLGTQHLEASAAMSGQGVAMLTPDFFRAELANGSLVQPFDLVCEDGHCYWLVYPETRRNVPKIRAFREWICREAERAD